MNVEYIDVDLGEIFEFVDGILVFVNEYTVGFVGGHPPNVDYYYSTRGGYGCKTSADVAKQYYRNFVDTYQQAVNFGG